jgi:hypothetical protein
LFKPNNQHCQTNESKCNTDYISKNDEQEEIKYLLNSKNQISYV